MKEKHNFALHIVAIMGQSFTCMATKCLSKIVIEIQLYILPFQTYCNKLHADYCYQNSDKV